MNRILKMLFIISGYFTAWIATFMVIELVVDHENDSYVYLFIIYMVQGLVFAGSKMLAENWIKEIMNIMTVLMLAPTLIYSCVEVAFHLSDISKGARVFLLIIVVILCAIGIAWVSAQKKSVHEEAPDEIVKED